MLTLMAGRDILPACEAVETRNNSQSRRGRENFCRKDSLITLNDSPGVVLSRWVLYVPDMYMLTASQGLLNPVNRAVKSVMDYAGGIVAFLLSSPIMAWAIWRIKREDGGKNFVQV